MEAIRLRNGFCWTGVIDDKLHVFDTVVYAEFGTTYNSYVMKIGDRVVLFKAAKTRSFDGYLEKLKEVADVTKVGYLVTNHTEPGHTGSTERLLGYSPQMKILATPCAISSLKGIVNRDLASIAIKDDQRMIIGKRTLHFMLVLNLHWPGIMYTFIEEEQVLVTCDSFGSHYCLEEVMSDKTQNEDGCLKTLRHYFDCVIGPYKLLMLKALDWVGSLDVSMVYAGHDLVLVEDRIKQVMTLYREQSIVVNPSRRKTVIIPYVSVYGYTGMLAERVTQKIADSGNTDVRSYNMVMANTAKVQERLQSADEMLFGTPTITTEALRPIWDSMLGMLSVTRGGKYAGALGSYGWSGKGVPHIMERLKQLKMKMVDGFRVGLKPSDTGLVGVYEFGYQFGRLAQSRKLGMATAKGDRKLVKCLVRGEIFDPSIEICPVYGMGRENFVPVEDVANDFANNTVNGYLILGSGAAGFSATRVIRGRDATGRATMISGESYPPYNHPALTESLVTGLEPEQIAMVDTPWYEESQARQTLGKRVESVDTDAGQALLDGGTKLRFVKLACALGSEYFIPSMEGSGLPEVAAIKRFSDVRRVEAPAKNTEKAVVIGGGVLRLEAAWELKRTGLEVAVLEMALSLMGCQMDGNSGKQLKTVVSKARVVICTDVNVEAIERDGRVSGVRLKTGEVVVAGMVIASIGIRANIELVKRIGLGTKKGIVVDKHMEASISGIYTYGDCARYHDGNYGTWSEVVEQGKIAGTNTAGDGLEYTSVPAVLTFHGTNTILFTTDDNGGNPNLCYKTVEFRSMGKEQYRKYCLLDNRMSGVILMGGLSRTATMTEVMGDHATYQEVMEN